MPRAIIQELDACTISGWLGLGGTVTTVQCMTHVLGVSMVTCCPVSMSPSASPQRLALLLARGIWATFRQWLDVRHQRRLQGYLRAPSLSNVARVGRAFYFLQ